MLAGILLGAVTISVLQMNAGFGAPVLPEEYNQNATSSAQVGAGARFAE